MSNIDFSKVNFQKAERVQVTISERETKYKDGEVTKINKLNPETHKNVLVGETIFSDYKYLLDNKFVTQKQLNELGANKYFIMAQNQVRLNALPIDEATQATRKIKQAIGNNPEKLAKLLEVMEKMGLT